jgi:hypothetical protein
MELIDDPVAVWKAISIVLTGAFGILGLLTEFKNKKTNRVTVWGYISLAGIVVSTVFGTYFQLKESSDNADKAFTLAQNTEETLKQVDRLLTPIEEPLVSISFKVPCTNIRYKSFCTQVRGKTWESSDIQAESEELWKAWPFKQNRLATVLQLRIFKDPKAADNFIEGDHGGDQHSSLGDRFGGLIFGFSASNEGKDRSLFLTSDPLSDEVDVELVRYKLTRDDVIFNDGEFVSSHDLFNATAVLEMPLIHEWEDTNLKLNGFSMEFKNGKTVTVARRYIEIHQARGRRMYRVLLTDE